MMAMGETGLMALLMLVLSGGGGNELLDYLHGPAYWKAKGVTVTAAALLQELAPPGAVGDISGLIKDLGANDFEAREAAAKKIRALGPGAVEQLKGALKAQDAEVVQRAKGLIEELTGRGQALAVRKLMAIRTLGELKDASAVPALEKLAQSQEPFVATYAQRALAAIAGKPAARAAAAAPESDLWRLPRDCTIVAQGMLPGGKPLDLDEAAKKLPALPGPMANVDKEQLKVAATQAVLLVAERVGNVRLDSATLGVGTRPDGEPQWAVIIFRGQYNRQAAAAALRETGLSPRQEEGFDILAEREVSFILASDNVLAFAGGERGQHEIAEKHAVKVLKQALAGGPAGAPPAGADRLRSNAEMVKLLEGAGAHRQKAIWGVAKLTAETVRNSPFVGLQSLAASVDQKPGAVELRADGAFEDETKAKASAEALTGLVKQGVTELEREVQGMPFIQPMLDFVKTVKLQADGKAVKATAAFKGEASSILGFPLMMFGMVMRAEAAVAPAMQMAAPAN